MQVPYRIYGLQTFPPTPFCGNSSTLATSCEELTHWKRLWCWEGLGRRGGEGDDRGWDGWMASLTLWIWVWVNSGSWWWTGRPGVLRFMGSWRVRHDWATELNWTHRIKTYNTKNTTNCTKKNHKFMIMVEYFQTYVSETNGLNCKNVDYRIFVQEKWESYSNVWA